MNKQDLQLRTKNFHIAVIKLCGVFPRNAAGFETAKQNDKISRVSRR